MHFFDIFLKKKIFWIANPISWVVASLVPTNDFLNFNALKEEFFWKTHITPRENLNSFYRSRDMDWEINENEIKI